MGSATATADEAATVAGHLARIEALQRAHGAALLERLTAQGRQIADLQTEVVGLRKQVADGKPREWLSVNATARRFDTNRAEVLRRIAAGDLVTRPVRSRGGWDTCEVHVDSARAAFGGA